MAERTHAPNHGEDERKRRRGVGRLIDEGDMEEGAGVNDAVDGGGVISA